MPCASFWGCPLPPLILFQTTISTYFKHNPADSISSQCDGNGQVQDASTSFAHHLLAPAGVFRPAQSGGSTCAGVRWGPQMSAAQLRRASLEAKQTCLMKLID